MLMEHLDQGTPLYANPDLFRERYAEREGKLDSVGISLTRQALAAGFSLALDAEPQEILPGVWTTGQITERAECEGGSDHHRMREGDELVADAYLDDLALVLEWDGRAVLLCGCCHAGLLNTLARAERLLGRPIDVVGGGLHLTSASKNELAHICSVLEGEPALQCLYPNHCTGEGAFVALTNALGSSVIRPCPAGTRLDLSP